MKIELFHKRHCPYSAKVRDFIDRTGIRSRVEYRDVDEERHSYERLLKTSGRSQVPCLLVDDKEAILESDLIITWLDTNAVKRHPDAA